MINLEKIRRHYAKNWGADGRVVPFTGGPQFELPPGFCVLEFPPTKRRNMWTYATCGMSQQADADPLELHLFSLNSAESLAEILTAIAHFHVTGSYLGLGHTVNFGRPWLPHSSCDHGLISLPYLDGPELEWLPLENGKIRCLWLIPITPAELTLKKTEGLEALEQRFDAAQFHYANPKRKSVV